MNWLINFKSLPSSIKEDTRQPLDFMLQSNFPVPDVQTLIYSPAHAFIVLFASAIIYYT